jgi:DNA-binding MarR family transcriptional regulator
LQRYRQEILTLTAAGLSAFQHLSNQAREYHIALAKQFSPEEFDHFTNSLKKLAEGP